MRADSVLQQAAEQAFGIAKILSVSTGITTRGLHKVAADIFSDMRCLNADEFLNIYGEVPVQIHSPCGATLG